MPSLCVLIPITKQFLCSSHRWISEETEMVKDNKLIYLPLKSVGIPTGPDFLKINNLC